MPHYDFSCPICGKTQEVFMRIADYRAPICCGGPTNPVLGNYSVIKDFQPYLDKNITDQPVLVKSKKHRQQLMKQYGVTEKIGKGWF